MMGIYHPPFLTIISASNGCDVSCGFFAKIPTSLLQFTQNPLVPWSQPHSSLTSSKQPKEYIWSETLDIFSDMYIKTKLFSFKFVIMYYSTLELLQRTGPLL